jgi:hypothetical protein
MTISNRIDAWAVVRYEPESTEPQIMVTVKEVLPSRAEAEREVERLQRLPEKPASVIYFLQHTRYYPQGRSVPESGDHSS